MPEDVDDQALNDWCREYLGAPVAERVFTARHLSAPRWHRGARAGRSWGEDATCGDLRQAKTAGRTAGQLHDVGYRTTD